MTKVEEFAALVAEQIKANYYADAIRRSSDYETWDKHIGSRIGTEVIVGPKYTKVNVLLPDPSARYMVENATGDIYGVKSYGKVNKAHYYGDLNNTDEYYWGGYAPTRVMIRLVKR